MVHRILYLVGIMLLGYSAIGTGVALLALVIAQPGSWRRRLELVGIVVVAWPFVLYGFFTPDDRRH